MKIVNMLNLTKDHYDQAAQLLTDSLPLGWATLEEARIEIKERLIPENTLIAALNNEEVLGWGGILAPEYDGNVFELHPLVVKSGERRKGIGRAIVTALEEAAKQQGGLTIYLGTDDVKEGGETSLANVDLYNDLPNQLLNFQSGTHQANFYLKLGYKIIGVLPDANGKGKPDIFLGKSLVAEENQTQEN